MLMRLVPYEKYEGFIGYRWRQWRSQCGVSCTPLVFAKIYLPTYAYVHKLIGSLIGKVFGMQLSWSWVRACLVFFPL